MAKAIVMALRVATPAAEAYYRSATELDHLKELFYRQSRLDQNTETSQVYAAFNRISPSSILSLDSLHTLL